jgi:signal transduction histidine kinase
MLDSEFAPLNATVQALERQFGWITCILVMGALILALAMSRVICVPMEKMSKSARRLAEGDYSVEFDGRGYREAGELADALNYATEELAKNDNLQKELVANISHDLRTPLTMVKAYAEMIRDLSGDNPVKREEHLGIIIDESDRLSALVNDILDLSRIESGNATLNISEFDISEKRTVKVTFTVHTIFGEFEEEKVVNF